MRPIISSSRQMSVIVFVATLSLGVLTGPSMSQAQMRDITSSGLNTQISTPTPLPDGTINYDITGGSRPGNGPNLFHSFGEFSIATDQIANFLNETNMPTENILSRVTGGNPSNIFGTIQTTNFDAANLYLINPAGVMFGPTASLNVGGSFAASTADYLKMTDGATFSGNPTQATVLSMAPVAAFGFLGATPIGTITVDGGTGTPSLTVQSGQNFSLIGGDISVTGRTLSAPGGQINLVSVASAGEVLPSATGQPAALSLNGFTALGNISLAQETTIDTSSNAAGPIFLRGGQLVMAGKSNILASTGDEPGGNIDVNVGHAQISESSEIRARTFGSGRGGDLVISTPLLTLADPDTVISARTDSTGNAGFITVSTGKLKLTGGSRISSTSNSLEPNAGNAGTITVHGVTGPGSPAGNVSLDGGRIIIQTIGGSAANTPGAITITAQTLALTNGDITADTSGAAPAGNIAMQVGTLTLEDLSDISSRSFSQTEQGGKAGNVAIQGLTGAGSAAAAVSIHDSRIRTSVLGGASDTSRASITITADVVEFANTPSPTRGPATLVASTFRRAPAGNIAINTKTLLVNSNPDGTSLQNSNRVFINSTSGTLDGSIIRELGPAGTITISGIGHESTDAAKLVALNNAQISVGIDGGAATTARGLTSITADTMTTTGKTAFFAFTSGEAPAGNIAFNVTNLTLGASEMISSTSGPGQGGDITITGSSATVGGTIEAETSGPGAGGAILANVETLHLTNGADLSSRSTSAQSNAGDAGQIKVQATGTFQSDDGSLATSAAQGKGGPITISAGNLTLTNETLVSAENTGSKDAGNIALTSGGDLFMRNSTVTTSALQGSGGGIKLTAPNLIRLVDSTITSSVQGQAGSNGGNINIDPLLVLIQNSQLLANANVGAGGNISIAATGAVLVDPNSLLSATAGPAGVSGSVNINAPIQVLSGALVPLNLAYSQAALSGDRCAADPTGQFSSFVQAGRDGVPQVPGALSPSPLLFLENLTSSSLESPWSNVAAARLGLNFVSLDDPTLFRFHSACRS